MAEEESLLERILDGEEEPADLSLELLQKITNRFSEETKIGQGGFGAVYKGLFRERIVAVKRIYVNLEKIDIDDKLYDREFNNLWKINHENVVRFLGFCSNTCKKSIEKDGSVILADVRERLFCFEYISGGSLDKHITDELRGLEWKTRYKIITGICKGLCYLHGEKIVHMDLKPANILIDIDNMVPKITDFGLSRSNTNSHTVAQPIGTLGYIAPEYREARRTIEACDIYSLGGIIMELVTGGMEVPDKHNVLRRWRHRWNNPPTPLQYQQVSGCIDIAVRCRKQDPKARPSINEIIELLNESTDGHTGQEIITYMDDDMLGIHPLELRFTSELDKEMSWSVKLTNKTKSCFAFNIERPSQQYTIRPDKGIVPPECNEYLVRITLQPQDRAPQVTQNSDMFVVHSRTVSNGYRVENITEHTFYEGANRVVDEVNLMVVYEPKKPLKNSKSREETNMPAEEVPEAKKRKIGMSASEKGKNKLGSSDVSEAASMDINSMARGQCTRQTKQCSLHPLQCFSRHYATNTTYLGEESRDVDVARGAMGSLLHKLGKLVTEDYGLDTRIISDIESFSEELASIHKELTQLEKLKGAKIWVDEVRERSYYMEDIVDSFLVPVEPDSNRRGYRELTHEGLKLLDDGMLNHLQIGDVIGDIKDNVQAMVGRKKKYKLDENNGVPYATAKAPIDPRISAIYLNKEQLVGIEARIDEIIRLLEEGGNASKQNLKKVSIVGLGGLGKTTLANAVYDKLKAQYHHRAFVPVGQNPDVQKVLRNILLEFGNDFSAETSVWHLRNKIEELLENKRYFIVIDDIWDSTSWDIINSAFPRNNCGSIVITTTRIECVVNGDVDAEVYKIKPLSDEDSRKLLFRKTLVSEDDCPSTSRKIAISNDILKTCAGMPLAINSIASLLGRDAPDSAWEYVKNSLGALTDRNTGLENMTQILNLSYIHLPDELKTCLLYVCMYPEDHEIYKNDLLRQWVAEGFVSRKGQLAAEDVAEKNFRALINMCMIEPAKIDYNNEVLSCTVHDLILDLIRSKSAEKNFIQVIDDLKDETGARGEIRRAAVHSNDEEDMRIYETMKNKRPLKHVRSVLFYRASLVPYFMVFKYVRVLHLEHYGYFSGLLDLTSISGLFLLRFLKIAFPREESSLYGTKNELKLPDQIGALQQLETIDLPGFIIRSYPSDIVTLPWLSHLEFGSFGIVLPDGIGMLKSLHSLVGLRLYESSINNINALGELTNLTSLAVCSSFFGDQVKRSEYTAQENALHSSISRLSTSLRILTMNIGVYPYNLDFSDWGTKLFPQGSLIRKLDLSKCRFRRCPKLIGQLHDLYSLSINVVEVADGVSIAAKLPSLAYFKWNVDKAFPQTERSLVLFGRGEFKALKHLCFPCKTALLTFEEGTLPKLEKLEIGCLYHRTRRYFPVGIKHLPAPTLTEIHVSMDCDWERYYRDIDPMELVRKLSPMLKRKLKVHHPGADIYIDFEEDGYYSEEDDENEDSEEDDDEEDDKGFDDEKDYNSCEDDNSEEDDGTDTNSSS